MEPSPVEQSYILAYNSLLKGTLHGAHVRAFVYGTSSACVHDYLTERKDLLWALQDEAYQAGARIQTRENLELGAKLLGFEARTIRARLGLQF